uniref:Uncharacterized protein n=1 Tax=Meloidogyne enterolobii TaxID=390850 RepID=A0A6V7YEY8_MELEN|nr:unnamed protein product [Meloidogyne enterolobii]
MMEKLLLPQVLLILRTQTLVSISLEGNDGNKAGVVTRKPAKEKKMKEFSTKNILN